MSDPSDFDTLYQEWLEIPADRLPPNHYALLGVDDFETDVQQIEEAAKARSAYLHQIASGPQRKIVQEVLGKVAMARRTLMSDESRAQYEAELRSAAIGAEDSVRSGSEETKRAAESESSGPAPNADDSSTRSRSSANASAEGRPRKKSGDWKYHAISAVALLAVVGIIFWANRGDGGRKAATVVENEKNDAAQPKRPARRTAKAAAGKKAPSTTPASSQVARRSPVVRKRATGSGIGAAMGGKFGDVLSDIENQSSSSGTDGSSGKGQADQPQDFEDPKGGASNEIQEPAKGTMTIGKVRASVPADQLPQDLTPVQEFPDQVAKRFECDAGFDWYQVKENRLEVKVAKGKKHFQLFDRDNKIHPGDVVQVSTSLTSNMGGDARLAFRIAGIQIGLRSSGKQYVEVIARDRGEDAKTQSVHRLKTRAKNATLAVQRDQDNPNRLQWFVVAGERRASGSIVAEGLGEDAAFAIVIWAPQKRSNRPYWLGNLMTSTAHSPPEGASE